MTLSLVNYNAGAYLSYGFLNTGDLPTFSFDPGDGNFVIVAVAGYRTANILMTFAPTVDGAAMTAVGPVIYANNNYGSSGHFQWFVLSGVSAGSKTIAGTWSADGTGAPRFRVVALSYRDVASYQGLVQDGGSELGTALSQTFSSSTGRIIVQSFFHEAAGQIGSYNQSPIINPVDCSTAFNGIIGQAAGAATVTFTGLRNGGNSYLETGFELIPTVPSTTGTMTASSKVLAMASSAWVGAPPATGQSGMLMLL